MVGVADGLHPAVLRLIRMTVQAAAGQDCWVGVCGELASDAQAIGVLVGLGVDEVSVSARQIPLVKARIRDLSQRDMGVRADQLLALGTAEAVREAVEVET